MTYWIRIFNREKIAKIQPEKVLAAVTSSNFHTLCEQYHLDQGLIQPALENLEIIWAENTFPLLFLVRYLPEEKPPIAVYRWDVNEKTGAEMRHAALSKVEYDNIRKSLLETVQVIAVELQERELKDLGLLLGYELARWGADLGKGIIYGLDGEWYCLNRHAAFIPMRSD